jgi:hypothetical protein
MSVSRGSLLLSFFILILSDSVAQIGGRYSYDFLGLPVSGRLTALGGNLIGVSDDDVNLAMSNPASLNEQMNNAIAFNHNFHFADISHGHVGFGKYLKKYGVTSHFSLSYIDYGTFDFSNELGQILGEFGASERAITIGAAKEVYERITVGANLKSIFSNYESYNSFGIATDLGMQYHNPDKQLVFSFLIRNLGYEIAAFENNRSAAPLDIQIGIAKQLKYLPFRFSIIAHQLQQWDIRYDDPNIDRTQSIFGTPVNEAQNTFAREIDNFFRHLMFNGEFLLGPNQNFRLRFGYNHLRRKELSVSNFRSMAGYSLGFGIKISKFRIDYGVGYHHLAGAANHLSISTNLDRFRKSIDL